MPDEREPILLFFDGTCALCDGAVVWAMKRDRRRVLKFAPLQGVTAQEQLGEAAARYPSIVLKSGSQVYLRSDAILRMLMAFGGIWRLARLLAIIPRPIRNAVYDYVANRRYRWFGTRESCRMPSPEDADRMLP